jgi:5'-nucleotidase
MSETKPRLLLTNDDGIQSVGLETLAAALEPIAEVWVVAPDRERSATSQAISLNSPLRLKKWRERWFSADGTPVDCGYLGLSAVLPGEPALVLSGINLGANLGQDVFYSGTVAAAKDAVIQGVQSVALSLDTLNLPDHSEERVRAAMERCARFSADLVARLLREPLPPGTLLNVNFPGTTEGQGPVEITQLGRRHYGKEVVERRDPRGRRYYWIGGARAVFEDIPGSDCNAVMSGKISISPMQLDLNEPALRSKLSRWDWSSSEGAK